MYSEKNKSNPTLYSIHVKPFHNYSLTSMTYFQKLAKTQPAIHQESIRKQSAEANQTKDSILIDNLTVSKPWQYNVFVNDDVYWTIQQKLHVAMYAIFYLISQLPCMLWIHASHPVIADFILSNNTYIIQWQ